MASNESDQRMENGVKGLLFNGVNNVEVQDKYILPLHERPRLSEVVFSASIPTLDLKDLDGQQRSSVLHEIRCACEEYGFFQIVNHGVSETVIKDMMKIGRDFFEMPVEDRACLYAEDPYQLTRLATSFNIRKEEALNWRDFLRHPCHPLEEYIDSWPQKPADYREIAAKYATEVRALILRLLAAISESLGLDPDYVSRALGKHEQLMTTNYYPACPKPDLTLAIAPHSDPHFVTVLLQDDVSGLQVLKDGKWVAVEPMPNAFVVNVGDQLQVLSNGRFKSVEHRAVTNSTRERISIPTFYGPSRDAFIAPAAPLVDDGEHPALYRGFTFLEFLDVFYSGGLVGKRVVDYFKI